MRIRLYGQNNFDIMMGKVHVANCSVFCSSQSFMHLQQRTAKSTKQID